MFGTLGTQEIVFIFLLALLLFGPKKLPEIGRTIGKAVTEFRRASNELKTTFENEMKTLEQETESLKQVTSQYTSDTYNYDYSTYESSYPADSAAASLSTESASATEGAESMSGVAPEGTVARGEETAIAESGSGTPKSPESSDSVPAPVPAASDHTA
jgi:TatA/E family protein of Tat protein translocase